MSSFTSNFKPILVAIVIIFAIESTLAAIVRPGFVERSNYLNWMFGVTEPLHKLLVYEKLSGLPLSSTNVIQVGDSSGFHGIKPRIVELYLGGLRYLNLSCCANTGFDGYYDIAKFALDRMKDPRAIVLYITFNNLPQQRSVVADKEMGASRIHDAFIGPWSIFSFPSEATRPAITDIVYKMGGIVAPLRPSLIESGEVNDAVSTALAHSGWWAVHDGELKGSRREKYYDTTCVYPDLKKLPLGPPGSEFYPSDLLGRVEFLPRKVFTQFAELAKRYQTKLIIIFHPHPCAAMDDASVAVLTGAISDLKWSYSNVAVYPEQVFEHWPRQWFTSWDHVRPGYEGVASRRAGKFVAAALGIQQPQEDPLLPDEYPPTATDISSAPLWSAQPSGKWRFDGLTVNARDGNINLTESSASERHYAETTIGDLLDPAESYIVSVRFKPLGNREVHLTLRSSAGMGLVSCSPSGEIVQRHYDFVDADMHALENGWAVCWAAIRWREGTAVLGVDIVPPGRSFPYAGDGISGLIIDKFEIRKGRRLSFAGNFPGQDPVGASAKCGVIGDGIAVEVSSYLRECAADAGSGVVSADVIGRVHAAGLLFVSAGSDDDDNPHLIDNLAAIRSGASGRVVWISPVRGSARLAVKETAALYGDPVVNFDPGPDNIHPRSYEALATALRGFLR